LLGGQYPSLESVFETSVLFLLLIVVYSVLEEIVFRGVLQGWWIKRWKSSVIGISYANIVISGVFVLMYLIYHAPLMAVAIFIPSLVFDFFRFNPGINMPWS